MRALPRSFRKLVLWSALVGWLGCGGDGGTGIEVPSLHITTATSGVEQDPDGYTVAVDGGTERPIGLTSSIEVGSLGDGPHAVELRGVAMNCTVQGSNPRTAQVTSGSTAEVAFVIECRPLTGGIRVTTTTTGPDQDEDGYVVVIEGDAREIDANGSITYGEMPAGSRVVELLGVVSNCTADTPTFTRATVTGGDTVEVAFGFTCTTRQPDTGTLQVTTTTTGPSPDPDGYLVSVDDGVPSAVPTSGSVLFPGIPAGTHSVAISGVAANCAVNGANPKNVTVAGTAVAVVAFDIVCITPPPTTGTLRVTTATGGADPDPDGYALAVDGGTAQPIGRNATFSITSLSAGSHALLLSGVAANCTVLDNPRAVTVPVGGVVDVTFTITCVPATGTIATTTVTTGASLDVDGYVARVDGGAGKEIPINGTVTRAGLAPGTHTVKLDNVAANCQVQGENPQSVVVAGNATTAVTFTVICAATTGTLTVTVAGLPSDYTAAVTVTGPDNYSTSVTGTVTLLGLVPGQYTVSAADVTVAPDTYTPSSRQQVVDVSAGGSPAVTVTYSRGPGGSVNLRIGGMYITQATQTLHDSVPLVADRDGYLRVFVVASQENSITPTVRVRLYQNGSLASTLRISAPTASTPTLVQESPLGASWNVRLSGSLIQQGLAVLVDVDPDAEVAESDETDNAFPLSGPPLAMAVLRASPFAVSLVPVQVGSGGLTGDVSPALIGQFLEPTLRRFPLPGYDADIHATFTSSFTPTQPGDVNSALYTALSELNTLRVVEGGSRTYYGVFHRNYSSGGIGGIAYLGTPTAIGYDRPDDAGRVAAHEFGHTWNRYHAPCGNPGGPDPNYPYVGGIIGVYGFNLALEALVEPTRSDLMGYCFDSPWVSDYTYVGVLNFRQVHQPASAGTRATQQAVQPSLLVWGRIQNGRPVLEPAFLVTTQPVLPTEPGPYQLEGVSAGGGRLFSISFDATPVADGPGEAEHFAFAVPLGAATSAQVSGLRLSGPVGEVAATALAAARAGVTPVPTSARRMGGRVAVQWDAASSPMAMVRDASTGEVLAFARGGMVEIPTTAAELEVHASDGILSRVVRVPVAP